MRIVFFDVQKWEEKRLKIAFPNAKLTTESLTPENCQKYKKAQIISGFIYSDFSKNTLKSMSSLKYISTRSTGFDHIDLDYCQKKGIKVSNIPEYGSKTVAEFTFALILLITKRLTESLQATEKKQVDRFALTGTELYKKTLGILGFGKIGRQVAAIAHGFGMKMLVFNRSHYPEFERKYNLKFCSLKEVLSKSDILTLHLPLNKETYHILNEKTFSLCKKGMYLVNTARGGLIDSEALLCAVEKGIIRKAALDVLEEEDDLKEEIEVLTGRVKKNINYKELLLNHILIDHPRILITPHNAFNTRQALNRITLITIKNINSFLKGSPINLVI